MPRFNIQKGNVMDTVKNIAKGAGEELSYLKGKGFKGAIKDVYDNTIGGDPTFKRMAKGDIFNTGLSSPLGSFKKGGKVKKTGVYKLHKGEEVLNAKEVMGKALANKIKR